jgi:hypothetical protein
MRKALIVLLLITALLPAAEKKGKSGKKERPPDATLIDFVAQREDNRLLLDGVVRINEVERPLVGLRIKFQLLASGNQLISQQNAVISEEVLEEGDEVPFYLQCQDHVRAVHVMVEVRGKKRMFLKLENPGPYGIE